MNKYLLEKYGNKINSTTIEVPIKDLNGKYFLPDDAILRGKRIISIFSPNNANDDAFSPNSTSPLPSPEAYRSAYLTLMCQNKSFLDAHPLMDLVITDSDRNHRMVEADGFNPSKSFIWF